MCYNLKWNKMAHYGLNTKKEQRMKITAEKIFKSPIAVVVFALICTALWGSATPFIKLGYQYTGISDGHVPSIILFAGTRFILAGLLTIVIYSIARRKFLYPKLQNLGRIGLISAFQTVIQYIFFYIGLANTTGVKGAIASGTSVFFSILVASLIFKLEKLTVKKVLACIIGFLGIIIVNLNGLDFTMNFLGDGFVLISAAASGCAAVFIKLYSKHEDPVVISGYQFFVGGIFMAIVGLIAGGRIELLSTGSILVLLYLGMLSAVAYSLWGVLLKYNSVARVTIFSFMTPVFGTILSKIMLSESSDVPLINLIITLLLVCLGIFLINYQGKSKSQNLKGNDNA